MNFTNLAVLAVIWIIIIALFIGVAAIIFFVVYRKRVYKFTAKFFTEQQKSARVAFSDKAKVVKVTQFGDKVLWLKKNKRYLDMPTRLMDKNEYWFAIREDGEVINFELENLNEKSKVMGIKFTDSDMRMARIGLEKHFRETFKGQQEWKKIATAIAIGAVVLILVVSQIVSFTQMNKLSKGLTETSESLNGVAVSVGKIANGLVNTLAYVEGKNPKFYNYNQTGSNPNSGLIPS